MLTLLPPLLKGVSAKTLGIGKEDDVGYVQCPDPGEPYTCGGMVVFKSKGEKIKEWNAFSRFQPRERYSLF